MLLRSFTALIQLTLPPTFSGPAVIDRYSDTTFSSSEHTGCGYPGLLDQKIVRAAGESRTLDFLRERRTLQPLGQALRMLMAIHTSEKPYTSRLPSFFGYKPDIFSSKAITNI